MCWMGSVSVVRGAVLKGVPVVADRFCNNRTPFEYFIIEFLLQQIQMDQDLLDLEYESKEEGQEEKSSKVYIPNSIDFYSSIVANEYMNRRTVEIREGDIISEGYLSKYKLYVVRTKKEGCQTTEVSRRFSDFEWLYQELIIKYGGYIIPILPEKHLLTKLNFESYEFSEKRRKDLQAFLTKLLEHPQIKYVPELRIFIEDKEKFISLLKGELEQAKTLEQKYDGIVSSFKGLFSQQSVVSNTDLVRQLDNQDKELNNNETILTNIFRKSAKLLGIVEEKITQLKAEATLLGDQTESLVCWDGLGTENDPSCFEAFKTLKRLNGIKVKELYAVSGDWQQLFIRPINHWLWDCEAALLALKRRRELIKEIVIDEQRIEELKLTYSQSNSRRDIEMDILKTKYQKNKDRADRMSKIMTVEIEQFTTQAKAQLLQLIQVFRDIQKKHAKVEIDIH